MQLLAEAFFGLPRWYRVRIPNGVQFSCSLLLVFTGSFTRSKVESIRIASTSKDKQLSSQMASSLQRCRNGSVACFVRNQKIDILRASRHGLVCTGRKNVDASDKNMRMARTAQSCSLLLGPNWKGAI